MVVSIQYPAANSLMGLWQLIAAWLMASTSQYHQTKEEIDREQKILAMSKKDPRYFAPIYDKYYDQIFVFIYKRLDDEEHTADVTSIVFLKCLKNLDRYKFQGVPFSAWLYRIAVNEVNQFFRMQKKTQRTVNLRTEHVNVLFEEMEMISDDEEPEAVVSRLLEGMKPEDVQFLEMRFFEGRSFKEIGYFLNITEVNAKVKTYRILKKLRLKAQELKLIE